ncbi:hypothetical protein rsdtw13_20040 [Clostridium sp. TW13]|uniref:Uncharacterized protein n=1 Tax=Inconstantimicrobium mannanitabidum TaxID=1604901 RepID=A0ACB5RCE3_9CLOT|nr:hypothetical protein rsdtw13_20040 [Clostridium sp. TW13]
MKNTMLDIEIKMMIPFDTLAIYSDDDDDEYNIEPTFVKIMELLNVEFDVRRIIEILYRYDKYLGGCIMPNVKSILNDIEKLPLH